MISDIHIGIVKQNLTFEMTFTVSGETLSLFRITHSFIVFVRSELNREPILLTPMLQ